MKIKFKKLTHNAQEPYQGTEASAGYDLTATSRFVDDFGNIVYGTGIAVEIPEGYAGLIFPRSSIYKKELSLTNCVGVIDADYRGEISAKFKGALPINRPMKEPIATYEIGDRICQLVIVPCANVQWEEAEELSNTSRGANGYGSTGK